MSNYEFWDELGKIFNAVVAYQEKTVEFNKRFINPWIRLGNVFDKQDRNDEAVDAYQKAIEIDPKNAQNWYEVGNIHFRMGKYDEAISAFNQAIELDPGFGWPYSNLALTYVSQGKFMEAIPLYRQSIELLGEDKDKAIAWNRLGNVYRKLNEYELAVESFQKADELDQENAGFRDNLDEQPEAPTLVEANTEDKEGPAVPVTVSLSELISAEPQAAEGVSENSDQTASAVEASTETPTVPIRVAAEKVEALDDTQPAAKAEAENEALDSQPEILEAEPSAITTVEAVDEATVLPEAEQQVQENVMEVSEETILENVASDTQAAPAEAEPSAITTVETVDEVSVHPEAEQEVPDNVAEVPGESIVENVASDVEPAAVEHEPSTITTYVVDEATVLPEAEQQVPENVVDVKEESTVEDVATGSEPAAIEEMPSATAPVDMVDEVPVLPEAEQQVTVDVVEAPQESSSEALVVSTDEVIACPEPAVDASAETDKAVAGDETVTIVVQSTVETFTETVSITDTTTETSDAALREETTEEVIDEPVAKIEELVVENVEQAPEPELVEASSPTVEETTPVETPALEAAEVETTDLEVPVEAEEPVVELTTTVVEVEVSVDQETNIVVQAADQPVTEQPAYEEYLKDSNNPIHIYESVAAEETVESENVPASQEPVAKIDSTGDVQIEMDTKNAHVWNELGNVYFNTGAFEDAVIAYSKAIELDRWFAWPYSNLALTYVQKGRFVEAILLYQRSIELFTSEKDKAISWNRLGNVYRRINDYENAIASYQRADELDPDNTTLSLQSRFSLLGSYVIEQKPSYVS